MSSLDQMVKAATAEQPPSRKAFLTAEWRWLVMLNWKVDPALLAPYVPSGCELDFHGDETLISVVGFLFRNTRLRGFSIPFHRNFAEVNLRLYVKRETPTEWRRGVVFLKEIVPRHAVSWVARRFYNENYTTLPMRHHCGSQSDCIAAGEQFAYEWRHRGRWNRIGLQAKNVPELPAEGTLERFIVEHYWGYSVQRDGSVLEYAVEHVPWHIAHGETLEVDCRWEELYGRPWGAVLREPPESSLVADGSEVSVYVGERLPRQSSRLSGTDGRLTPGGGGESDGRS